MHRLEMLPPDAFLPSKAPRRLREVLAWKRDTLQPLFGLAEGLELTLVQSILEIDDYAQFFAGRLVTPRDSIGVASGPPRYSFPRRGFDLWDSRYVVMGVTANGWLDEKAGFERVYPPDQVVQDAELSKRWINEKNWQLPARTTRTPTPAPWLVSTMSGSARRSGGGAIQGISSS